MFEEHNDERILDFDIFESSLTTDDDVVAGIFRTGLDYDYDLHEESENEFLLQDEGDIFYDQLRTADSDSVFKPEETEKQSRSKLTQIAKEYYNLDPASTKRKYSTYKFFSLNNTDLIQNADQKYYNRIKKNDLLVDKARLLIDETKKSLEFLKLKRISKKRYFKISSINPKFRVLGTSFFNLRIKRKKALAFAKGEVLNFQSSFIRYTESQESVRWSTSLSKPSLSFPILEVAFSEIERNHKKNKLLKSLAQKSSKTVDRLQSEL